MDSETAWKYLASKRAFESKKTKIVYNKKNGLQRSDNFQSFYTSFYVKPINKYLIKKINI